MNELLPKLEDNPREFQICFHTRDWLPGEWIQNHIIRTVEESRRIVIVLSNSFINSVWGLMEFKYAYYYMKKENRNRVIIILYNDIQEERNIDEVLKNFLKLNTYVKWGDVYFWEKLLSALPKTAKQLKNK